MTVDNIEDFRALEPFFRVIEEGLAGLVDGGHFFDLLKIFNGGCYGRV
jgi:hypothetical protein